jgi:hypothetical protein
VTTETPTRRAADDADFADRLLDELLPEGLEWRRLVTAYPLASLAAAALGGYLLGRSRGATMVGAVGAFASETVSRSLNALAGEDVL